MTGSRAVQKPWSNQRATCSHWRMSDCLFEQRLSTKCAHVQGSVKDPGYIVVCLPHLQKYVTHSLKHAIVWRKNIWWECKAVSCAPTMAISSEQLAILSAACFWGGSEDVERMAKKSERGKNKIGAQWRRGVSVNLEDEAQWEARWSSCIRLKLTGSWNTSRQSNK